MKIEIDINLLFTSNDAMVLIKLGVIELLFIKSNQFVGQLENILAGVW